MISNRVNYGYEKTQFFFFEMLRTPRATRGSLRFRGFASAAPPPPPAAEAELSAVDDDRRFVGMTGAEILYDLMKAVSLGICGGLIVFSCIFCVDGVFRRWCFLDAGRVLRFILRRSRTRNLEQLG